MQADDAGQQMKQKQRADSCSSMTRQSQGNHNQQQIKQLTNNLLVISYE